MERLYLFDAGYLSNPHPPKPKKPVRQLPAAWAEFNKGDKTPAHMLPKPKKQHTKRADCLTVGSRVTAVAGGYSGHVGTVTSFSSESNWALVSWDTNTTSVVAVDLLAIARELSLKCVIGVK